MSKRGNPLIIINDDVLKNHNSDNMKYFEDDVLKWGLENNGDSSRDDALEQFISNDENRDVNIDENQEISANDGISFANNYNNKMVSN
ncbi:hypothetical protein FQA39_LY17014 [Lamprigera yunnana]|nr:hypothetical protein FQA39_LY17014 [Lamprigera yunnana]